MKIKIWRVAIFITTLLISCNQKEEIVEEIKVFNPPSDFPEPVYQSDKYEFTEERVDLGRKLFYDTKLSVDNSISCGTCHAQAHAFADHNTALSTGVNGLVGTRNSPALINMAWNTSFFHDGGVNHLEVFPLAPIVNPVEMAHDIAVLMDSINLDTNYQKLFHVTFDSDSIVTEQMFVALAQFQSILISDNSKYDKVMRGERQFTNSEQRGFDLFNAKCESCHSAPLFTDYSFVNNGLDWTFEDAGRALISQNPADSGKFKVPTLRNVGLTNPYMHDGRFVNLRQVLDHYSDGVKDNGFLDERLMEVIPLTETEKDDLIAFLNSLTDYDFVSNSAFAPGGVVGSEDH